MVRKARDKNTFGTYYITQNANVDTDLFSGDEDRKKFLDILEKTKSKFDYKLYAYCLTNNNFYQLIIFDNGSDISKIMKSINISYSMYKKCDRKLFKDRYKSYLIKDYFELLEYTKKIHCHDNKWNSYCHYISDNKISNTLLDSDEILNTFKFKDFDPKKSYKDFLDDKLDFKDIVCDKNIIFCEDNKNCISCLKEANTFLQTILEKENISFENLIKNKSRRNSLVKYFRKNSLLTLKEIGALFGNLSESTICKIINK
ncbi:transposase [Helicovermis profundi]|uniref:Transposase IS200-like domain-containing protein n=1 Tax=Helicovermis profundi TaxID=3065157 RepID=A0AAU9EY79_9FIRM|nr:hypothetical protein HLPR_23510 [Clostridia bacterium S502]